MSNSKKYDLIITGPTSYVAKFFIPKLIKKYDKNKILLLTWNKDTPTGKTNLKKLKKYNIPTKKIDLVTREGLDNLPKNPKTIIHLAAEVNTSLPDHRANDIGTKNLYQAFGKLSKNTHFIYTGTTVYFGGRPNCKKPLTEKSKPYPTNEYTRTKLRAKKYLYKKCNEDDFKLTELQLNTVYGPDPRPNSLFEHIPEKVKNNSLFTKINWPGKTSLVHVEDVSDLLIHFIQNNHPKPGNPQTFILTSETRTIAEISHLFHTHMGKLYRPINIPGFIWKQIAKSRQFIPYLETPLPASIYNLFWRASLIIDSAVYTDSTKLLKLLPNWKPRQLKNEIKNLI